MASLPMQHLQSEAGVPPIVSDRPAPLASVPIGKHFKITPTGLDVIGEPPFEVCADFGEMLRTFDVSLQFVIGDYCKYIDQRFGDGTVCTDGVTRSSSQILDATGWSEKTIKVYTWVAGKIAAPDRKIDQGLSFKHHLVVAALPPPKQRQWLDKAMGEEGQAKWSASRLGKAVRADAEVPETHFGFYVTCADAAHCDKLLALVVREGGIVKERAT